MDCVHVRKRASGAPRTPFRPCKNLKISWERAPRPPHTTHFVGPQFLYLPRAPPILSAALHPTCCSVNLSTFTRGQPKIGCISLLCRCSSVNKELASLRTRWHGGDSTARLVDHFQTVHIKSFGGQKEGSSKPPRTPPQGTLPTGL